MHQPTTPKQLKHTEEGNLLTEMGNSDLITAVNFSAGLNIFPVYPNSALSSAFEMITVLQILMVLLLIVLIIIMVFKPRRKTVVELPDHYTDILQDYVSFYAGLTDSEKKVFEKRLQHFLSSVKITAANAVIEDLDIVLLGAAAVIPVYHIPDWEYINLREIIVYPGNFNADFEQHGNARNVSGMVGTGVMQHVMIISKWDLRQGFIHTKSNRNTAIHEFVHLIDNMDGTMDGVPEILLERKYVAQWKQLLQQTIDEIKQGQSDIDVYAAHSPVECFAVLCEYFFEQPVLFSQNHPHLYDMLQRIFIRP